LARLFFGYFLLAKQKKVTRPSRPKPVFETSAFKAETGIRNLGLQGRNRNLKKAAKTQL
jgi:hypothetical protein